MWLSAQAVYGEAMDRPMAVTIMMKPTSRTVSSFTTYLVISKVQHPEYKAPTYSSVETAAAVRAVPRTTPPVLVHKEVLGTELMIDAARSSGESSATHQKGY